MDYETAFRIIGTARSIAKPLHSSILPRSIGMYRQGAFLTTRAGPESAHSPPHRDSVTPLLIQSLRSYSTDSGLLEETKRQIPPIHTCLVSVAGCFVHVDLEVGLIKRASIGSIKIGLIQQIFFELYDELSSEARRLSQVRGLDRERFT